MRIAITSSLDATEGAAAVEVCVALCRLGVRPILVGTAGRDLADQLTRLTAMGVDTESAPGHTVGLGPVLRRAPDIEVVVIGANDPATMVRLATECRRVGVPFAANPAERLAMLDSDTVRSLVEGAFYLFTTESERTLLGERTGWTDEQVRQRIGTWITTLGAAGVRIEPPGGGPAKTIAAASPGETAAPDYSGAGFLAGFLAARHWYLSYQAAARLGCLMATTTPGPSCGPAAQLDGSAALDRLTEAYGASAAGQLAPFLATADRTVPTR
jgi:adenosine kinase